MFRKKVEIKGCTSLKTSDKKKFRSSVAAAFFQQSSSKLDADEDDGMPTELRASLVKGDLALTKAVTDNGNKQFEFYALDKTPIFFVESDHLFPTVYLLWTVPNLLPRVYTHAEVFEKLKAGADLMLPGVIMSGTTADSFNFSANAVCSVCVIGNDAAMAVGRALMSGAEMLSCEVRKGKAVQIFQTYQDCLWELGPKTRAPIITLPRPSLDQAQENAIVSELSDALDEAFADSTPSEPDDNSTPTSSLSNDTRFLLYFLYALQKRLRRDDDLPILASTFYGSVLLPFMPPDEKITVQETTFKKFSAFLRRMQEDGLIAIEEPKKGVENIAGVRRDHELFGQYSDELKVLPTSDRMPDQSEGASSTVNERPVNFRELRAITAPVLPLFHSVNKGSKKGQALSATDVRAVITSYVKSKSLADGRSVKLDDLLLKCVVSSSADTFEIGDSIAWEKVMESVFNKMTPCIEIEYKDSGATASGESRKEVKKGKPPSIRIRVAKRSGNKKVTMIDNVQEFGIDPKTFAHELQVALAVSATLNESPGSIGPQVQVQGDQSEALRKIFIEKYGINKKYLQIG